MEIVENVEILFVTQEKLVAVHLIVLMNVLMYVGIGFVSLGQEKIVQIVEEIVTSVILQIIVSVVS